jgi:hypothetical protein
MLKKPAVLAALGAVGGIVVALLLFVLVIGGGGGEVYSAEPTPEPTPVATGGKLGPHIVLQDRIFNLISPSSQPVYLKLQTIIEFETTDERWAKVLAGCVALPAGSAPLVSRVPVGGEYAVPAPSAPSGGGGGCDAQHAALLSEFEAQVGTGRQLIEDAITSIVASKSPEELGTAEGKERLKAEIKAAVEARLEDRHVTRVLFVNFITQ